MAEWTIHEDDGDRSHVIPVDDDFSRTQAAINGHFNTRLCALEVATLRKRWIKRAAAKDIQRLQGMLDRERAKEQHRQALQEQGS